jgi:hypothetical protein
MTQAQLHSEIIARSEATAWDEAKREWTLKNVWMCDDPETCLCGHHPIKEICEIENQVNHKVTEVDAELETTLWSSARRPVFRRHRGGRPDWLCQRRGLFRPLARLRV